MTKRGKFSINRTLNYTFLFLRTRNIHLIKEIGMIPYYFHRMYKLQANVVTYKNDNYPFLKKYCKGLEMSFVKKPEKIERFPLRNVLKYLIINAKKIDFLNLILPHYGNALYGVIFKIFNRKGYIYLKLDIDQSFKKRSFYFKSDSYTDYGTGISAFIKFQIKKKVSAIFLDLVDLISIESIDLVKFFKNTYPEYKNKTIYIPNGVDDLFIKSTGIKTPAFKDKENIILTVGNIGHETKSHEVFFEAISKIKELKDWRFLLIGPIQKPFLKYIETFFKKNPHLKEKIILIGEVSDRKKLFEYYQKSKIYCSTSKYESFGFTLIESAYFGNYIVSSDFTSAREITMNGTLGSLYEFGKSEELANILQELIVNQEKLEESCSRIITNAKEKFSWSNIIRILYREISSRRMKN